MRWKHERGGRMAQFDHNPGPMGNILQLLSGRRTGQKTKCLVEEKNKQARNLAR